MGDLLFVSGFEMVGAHGFPTSPDKAVAVLRKLIEEGKFKLIILPESLAEATSEVRMQVVSKGKTSPIFAVVPDLTGVKEKRIKELQSLISVAVGAKLEFK